MHRSRQWNCRSLRCSWSIACRRCSNYSFILNLPPGLKGLGNDDFKTRWESFKYCNLVGLILEILRYFAVVIIAALFLILILQVVYKLIVAQWHHMVLEILVNTDSGSASINVDLLNRQWSFVAFTWQQPDRKCWKSAKIHHIMTWIFCFSLIWKSCTDTYYTASIFIFQPFIWFHDHLYAGHSRLHYWHVSSHQGTIYFTTTKLAVVGAAILVLILP